MLFLWLKNCIDCLELWISLIMYWFPSHTFGRNSMISFHDINWFIDFLSKSPFSLASALNYNVTITTNDIVSISSCTDNLFTWNQFNWKFELHDTYKIQADKKIHYQKFLIVAFQKKKTSHRRKWNIYQSKYSSKLPLRM